MTKKRKASKPPKRTQLYAMAHRLLDNNFQPVLYTRTGYLISVELGGKELPGTMHRHEYTRIEVIALPGLGVLCATDDPDSSLLPQVPGFQLGLIQTLLMAKWNLSTEVEPQDRSVPSEPDPTLSTVFCQNCGADLSREGHLRVCEDYPDIQQALEQEQEEDDYS